MTRDPTIDVRLNISSLTVTSERMIEILPFTPTKRWSLGDAVGKSSVRCRDNGVAIVLPSEVGWHLEPVVLKLLDLLEPMKSAFVRATTDEMLDCQLACMAVFTTSPPSCSLEARTIGRIAELGLSFDLDLIFAPE